MTACTGSPGRGTTPAPAPGRRGHRRAGHWAAPRHRPAGSGRRRPHAHAASRPAGCAGCRHHRCACRRARSGPASWCPGAAAPRLGPLIAHDRGPRGARTARVPPPPQHLAHRRGGAPQQRPERHGTGAAALARREDLRLGRRAQAPGLVRRGGRTLPELPPAPDRIAPPPAIAGGATRADRLGCGTRAHASQHRRDRATARFERIAHPSGPSSSIIHRNSVGIWFAW